MKPRDAHPAPRDRVTTTHDPNGGGSPRLIVSTVSRHGARVDDADGRPIAFELLAGVTTIGSSEAADIHLDGILGRHAEVRRSAADEYVFVALGPAGASTVNGVSVQRKALHTGDRLELGGWVMSFYREEFADHGRPYGGRQGGEGSHQRPQQAPRRRGTTPDGGSDRSKTDPGEYK